MHTLSNKWPHIQKLKSPHGGEIELQWLQKSLLPNAEESQVATIHSPTVSCC